MKSPLTVSVLVWICNILLAFLVTSFTFGIVYYIKFPGLSNIDRDLEGVSKSSFRFSQSFLSDNFIFERNIDKEKGIDEEKYYFASTRDLYEVSFSDSLYLYANKITRYPADSFSMPESLNGGTVRGGEITFFGINKKNVILSEPAGTAQVRFAAPAISLDREEYLQLARSNVLFMMLVLFYLTAFFWYLRKFVAGLRKPVFFTKENVRYLYVTSFFVLLAPILMWIWHRFLRPDLFADLEFTRASAVAGGSELSAALFIFGILLLTIAWCFDHGVKLQKEQELTI
ncbi:MAG: DUF2975 domain-containing protein [Balneolaceae bacterium]|nr:MAG: DUF2975 domain-containing protein [Balneolaceae bacterium]